MGDTDGSDVDLPSPGDADPSFGSEHLLELLTELRRRLEAVALVDQDRRPDATALIRQVQERIVTLERMLAWAHAREAELTARTVRGEMRIAHLESTVGELDAIGSRASEAEAGRIRAETDAAELQQHLTAARAELQYKDAEVRRLSVRCREFESDLATLADELASTAVTRAKAERLERERDVALERASAESGQALEARLRAADAERQLKVLRDRLGEAVERSTSPASVIETPDGGSEDEAVVGVAGYFRQEREAGFEALEDDEIVNLPQESDVVEYEDDEDDEGSLTQEQDMAEYETVQDDEVVDLTQEPNVTEYETLGDDEPIVWGEPARPGGLVGWLRRGIGSDPDEGSERRD
jgi:hypothetical protein